MSASSNNQPITRADAVAIAHASARSIISKEVLGSNNDLINALQAIAQGISEIAPALQALARSGNHSAAEVVQASLPIPAELAHSAEHFSSWALSHRSHLLAEQGKTGKKGLRLKEWRAIYAKSFPLNDQDKLPDSYGRPVWYHPMKNSIYRSNGLFYNYGHDLWGMQ